MIGQAPIPIRNVQLSEKTKGFRRQSYSRRQSNIVQDSCAIFVSLQFNDDQFQFVNRGKAAAFLAGKREC